MCEVVRFQLENGEHEFHAHTSYKTIKGIFWTYSENELHINKALMLITSRKSQNLAPMNTISASFAKIRILKKLDVSCFPNLIYRYFYYASILGILH